MNLLKQRRIQFVICAGVVGCGVGGWCGSAVAAASAQEPAEQSSQTADEVVSQARGEEALVEGRAHLQAGRYKAAQDAFSLALRYLPNNEEARQGLETAQVMLNQASIVEDVQTREQILRDQTRAEFKDAISRSQELLKQQDFDGAERLALTAKIKLDSNRQLLGEADYAALAREATTLADQIRTDRETWRLEEQQRAEIEAQTAQERERRRVLEERQTKINENLRRVRQLQLEMKYDEALQVVDQTLFLDELNPAALALRDVLQSQLIYMQYSRDERDKEFGVSRLLMENKTSMVPPRGLVDYPDDWPKLSLSRINDTGWRDTPGDKSVANTLITKRLPLDLDNVPFEQAVGFLGTATGLRFYVDWKALSAVGVNKEDPVTLRLGELAVGSALQRILEQVGAGDDPKDRPKSDIQEGTIVISSDAALRKRVVTIVYDIRDLLFEVPNFDNAPQLNLGQAFSGGGSGGGGGGSGGGGGGFGGGGGGSGGGSGGGGGGGLFGETGEQAPRKTREELVRQILDIITNTVDFDGWDTNGGDTGRIQELNGNLIITNTVGNHRSVEGLLSQLREIRALQINVESRFLNVSNDWFEQIGFDLDLYFNTNNTVFDQLRAADPNAHLSDLFSNGLLVDPFIFGNGSPLGGAAPGLGRPIPTGSAVGVPITPPAFGAGDPSFSDIQYIVGPVGAPIRTTSGFAPIGLPQQSYAPNGTGLVNKIADLGITSIGGIAAASPAISFGVQFLDDVQVDLLIQATQADKRSVVLTAPRLTFFNGQRAWVAVTTQQYFASGLTAVSGDGSLGFVPTIAPQFEGVVMDVEGVISADRRYVTLTVIPSIAEIIGTKKFTATGAVAGTGGVVGAGGTASVANDFETPIVSVQQVQTTVSVPDKGTALLGGQRQVREIEVEVGVPFLSKIPFINRFFTNRLTQKEESTLLILVRPEIIIQQENEDRLFPGLADQLAGRGASYVQ